MPNENQKLRVGLIQMAPVLLDRLATQQKMLHYIDQAAQESCTLAVFGEALLPGYPHWLAYTNAALFNAAVQKDIHAEYLNQAVQIERGDLKPFQNKAQEYQMAMYLGIIERPLDRGGHSLYCSLVYLDTTGAIQSVHRKLMPTYEERLSWSIGDGNGLKTHPLGAFSLGGLNCWENWMPLARSALYGMGENLHVAVWPGSMRNTTDITPFLAKEGRSFCISVSGLLYHGDIPNSFPHQALFKKSAPPCMADGGSCIAAPDGRWVISPQGKKEGIFIEELDPKEVFRERQNFDPSGHYSRPDVLTLTVNLSRQQNLNKKMA